jgi:flagellar biosynthesis/type III secretory pathway chaperone
MTEVLDQEAEVYRVLVELSSKKQKALVEGDLEALPGIIRAEESLLWQAGRVEETRQMAATELADELHLSEGERTLGRLIEIIGGASGERLREQHDEILKAVTELAEGNQINGRLIEQAMNQVKLTINLLAKAKPGGAAYGPDGGRNVDGGALKIDRQV